MIRLLSLASLLLLSACATGRVQIVDRATNGTETTVILVRHAEKRTDQGNDPELSPAGSARAEALAVALIDAGVDVIVGSQFRRTSDTAAPLARRLGLDIVTRALDTRDSPNSAANLAPILALEYAGQTILVSGHSDTIPPMVTALTGIPMDELDINDYDNLFIVSIDVEGRATLIRSRFGAPDSVP